MARALDLAWRGWGRVQPDPLVGAVVLSDGEPVGEGWHPEYGDRHAETVALADAGERARGATLVVTLEPCSHQGKQPPCTEAIIRSGVRPGRRRHARSQSDGGGRRRAPPRGRRGGRGRPPGRRRRGAECHASSTVFETEPVRSSPSSWQPPWTAGSRTDSAGPAGSPASRPATTCSGFAPASTPSPWAAAPRGSTIPSLTVRGPVRPRTAAPARGVRPGGRSGTQPHPRPHRRRRPQPWSWSLPTPIAAGSGAWKPPA